MNNWSVVTLLLVIVLVALLLHMAGVGISK